MKTSQRPRHDIAQTCSLPPCLSATFFRSHDLHVSLLLSFLFWYFSPSSSLSLRLHHTTSIADSFLHIWIFLASVSQNLESHPRTTVSGVPHPLQDLFPAEPASSVLAIRRSSASVRSTLSFKIRWPLEESINT